MTTLTLTPLTGTLGAEVSGIDLRRPLDAPAIGAIRTALLHHRVLFFRDQLLSPQELVRFGRHFGALTPAHPVVPSLDGHPEVLAVDSAQVPARIRARDRAAGDAKWHTDVTFSATPPLGSLLNAHTVPPRGGDTLWSDLVDAYASLSAPLRALLTQLEAVHDGRQVFGYFARDESGSGARERLQQLAPVRHPVVRRHPETDELGLFVNPTFTSHIVGLTPRESAALLGLLYDQIAQPERTVRWRWRAGDLAFWDNRATAHYATLDYGDAARRLLRITLAGDRPYGVGAGAGMDSVAPPQS